MPPLPIGGRVWSLEIDFQNVGPKIDQKMRAPEIGVAGPRVHTVTH